MQMQGKHLGQFHVTRIDRVSTTLVIHDVQRPVLDVLMARDEVDTISCMPMTRIEYECRSIDGQNP